MAKILLVDDEPQIRRPIAMHLERTGHEVESRADGAEALEALSGGGFDLVITDIRMPKVSGLELLERLRAAGDDVPVIVLTALSGVETAVEAMKLGADDYICKPPSLEEITIKTGKLLEARSLSEENRRLKSELDERFGFEGIVGESPAIREVIEKLRPLARDRDISVLILGESGTGKELAARAIHYNGPRSSGPFVAVNCAALPVDLIESELFGHERGAFTGAHSRKKGLFEAADGGTLFLDEISTMPPETQAKLLRAIETREYRSVGSTESRDVDIRLLSASNRKLSELVSEGGFRQDLFYRIAVAELVLPPLRERFGDVALLASHWLDRFAKEKGRELHFSAGAFKALDAHDWPGNIRELRNAIEVISVVAPEGEIEAGVVESAIRRPEGFEESGVPGRDFKSEKARVVEEFERQFLVAQLKRTGWNISRTAQEIGLSRSVLHSKLAELGLDEIDSSA